MLPVPSGSEISALLPEIIIAFTMCVALLAPVLTPLRRTFRESHTPMIAIAIIGLGCAIVSTLCILNGYSQFAAPDHYIVFNTIAVDHFALTFKLILYVFTLFVLLLWATTTRDKIRTIDNPDYVCLILGGVLGMSLMASATNFLMIFLAIEAASFPSFALAGFYKTTRRGAEASLKYVIFGAAASSIMLYGLSMLYGTYGTLDLAEFAMRLGDQGVTLGLIVGLGGLLIGLGFKLSAVPMHFWCPDVFEAAPFEITTFLSVASKGAAIALLLRITMTLGYYTDPAHESLLVGISTAIGILGLVTATWGNLGAYFQTNIKRLLAYSSIAHSGYMIMAASLLTTTMRSAHGGPAQGNTLAYALLFYILVYAFMNYGAFSIAARVDRATGSENIADYAGLATRSPLLAFVFGAFLMALFGMPGTGGFWGKVFIGFQMWNQNMWWLVAGLVINTVLSLYIYLKPIITMVWKPAEDRSEITMSPASWLLICIALFGVLATGILPDRVTSWTRDNAIITYTTTPEVQQTDTDVIAVIADDAARTQLEVQEHE